MLVPLESAAARCLGAGAAGGRCSVPLQCAATKKNCLLSGPGVAFLQVARALGALTSKKGSSACVCFGAWALLPLKGAASGSWCKMSMAMCVWSLGVRGRVRFGASALALLQGDLHDAGAFKPVCWCWSRVLPQDLHGCVRCGEGFGALACIPGVSSQIICYLCLCWQHEISWNIPELLSLQSLSAGAAAGCRSLPNVFAVCGSLRFGP